MEIPDSPRSRYKSDCGRGCPSKVSTALNVCRCFPEADIESFSFARNCNPFPFERSSAIPSFSLSVFHRATLIHQNASVSSQAICAVYSMVCAFEQTRKARANSSRNQRVQGR
jgi:hypothetical protein